MYENLLPRFFSKDQLRPNLCGPNLEAGYVYGTDGHCLIRVPENKLIAPQEGWPIVPKIDYFKAVWPETLRMLDAPIQVNVDALAKAMESIGTHIVYEDCEKCGGDGQIDCPCCWQQMKCKTCDGSGQGKAVGTELNDDHNISLGCGVYLAPRLAEHLVECALDIGEPIFMVTIPAARKGQLFRTGEAEILLMPRDYRTDKVIEMQFII